MADENETLNEEEPTFEVGESVVIREDFHSKYFQGLHATIAGPVRKGGTPQALWPLKIDVAPYQTVMAGKYLRRPSEEEIQSLSEEGASGDGAPASTPPKAKKSLLGRIIPWNRK